MSSHEVELRARVNAVRLTPTLRLVAEYVVEHPGTVLRVSSKQLAEEAGVSQASVSRFCQTVGLDDYADLQQWLSELLLGRASDPTNPVAANRFQALADDESSAVSSLAEWLGDASALQHAAHLLMTSQPMLVFGTRIAEPFARLFTYLATRICPEVRLITSADSTAYDQLGLAVHDGTRAALAFVLPRVERETVQLVRSMTDRGVEVVMVADPRHLDGPIDAHLLPVTISSQLLFDSHASVTVMIVALLDAMGETNRSAAQARLDAAERAQHGRA